MLQNAGADRVFVIRLLLAGTNADEQDKNSYGRSQVLHARSSLNDELPVTICFQALRSPFGTSGKSFSRMPVASNSAFPTAGAIAMIGVSPAPADGMSFRSRRTASISGTSRKRGTR